MSPEPELFQQIQNHDNGTSLSASAEQALWEEFGDTQAMLIADSSGFTRLSQEHGVLHFLMLVKRMRDIVLPILNDAGALNCYGKADNIFGFFPTCKQAYQAALQSHRALLKYNQSKPASEHFFICIGIGFGKILRAGDEGVFGNEMNFASKLGEDIAEPQEILLTESAMKAIDSQEAIHFQPNTVAMSGINLKYYARTITL